MNSSSLTHNQKQIRVGVVGAGSMGRGVAFQIEATPHFDLAWVTDQNTEIAKKAGSLCHSCLSGDDTIAFLKEHPVDVLVECTNSIEAAAEYCLAAFKEKTHVVLMNAEVDLALGPILNHHASIEGVTISSDAGDQHGVLASLISEADLMGFDIVQAGNIKGFLDRDATPESIRHEAKKRNLSPVQCCAYTDGTKLHIEMAVLANALGYLPPEGGMTGPEAKTVHEALQSFDFSQYGDIPRIDYLLGAEPGGGVYLIVRPKKELPEEQTFYLNYYKLGKGPEYLLYRPYHLCHLETPKAILAALSGQPILQTKQQSCDVYAYAKKDLTAGELIQHAIGSAECYGLVEPLNPNKIPISLLEATSKIIQDLKKDEALTWEHIELPKTKLFSLWQDQQRLLSCPSNTL